MKATSEEAIATKFRLLEDSLEASLTANLSKVESKLASVESRISTEIRLLHSTLDSHHHHSSMATAPPAHPPIHTIPVDSDPPADPPHSSVPPSVIHTDNSSHNTNADSHGSIDPPGSTATGDTPFRHSNRLPHPSSAQPTPWSRQAMA